MSGFFFEDMKDTTAVTDSVSLEKLQKRFGFNSFKPLQKEIIHHVLDNRDAVILMPTGGGKSICYQLPALLLDGLTLVISPLISLMKDQVGSLRGNGIAAAYLNSSLLPEEEISVKQQLHRGEIKLLYISPERLFSGNFLDYTKQLNIKLIAVDEAHCISSWGHHFRPEYRNLKILKQTFPGVPVIALTATADKAVRYDIGKLLELEDPKYFIASFDRPNLSLAVLPGRKKWEQIMTIVRRHEGSSGIIYCSSRKATEDLAKKLLASGINAKSYHAGLGNTIRSNTQEEFILGKIKVLCATIAFGMGIDKPDIRFVIHHNMPGNMESYYQEIGRAGRDGMPAETILFYSYRDVQTHIGFIEDIDDEAYKKILLAKLDRMKEYAEAQVCRRKILLTYFSEMHEKECQNCDVCFNPPDYFDGTIITLKALSAISRAKEKAGVTTLIDILKGTMSPVVKENNFDRIKTFGAGKDTTAFAWLLFIQQFIQQGIVELDYKDHYNLKLTSLSHSILYKGQKVKLVSPDTIRKRQKKQKEKIKPVASASKADESLFEQLRILRRSIAKEIGKPAFVVFSDTTLKDMTVKIPANMDEFLDVSGVGEYKADMYGETFINAIASYLSGKKKGNTYVQTWEMYRQGRSVEEIAKERGMQPTTVYSHLAYLISNNYNIDVNSLVTPEETEKMKKAINAIGYINELKPYYEYLEGSVDYGKIRLILSYFTRAER